jgi:uncharacterized iron-regulated membrane protein
MVVRASQRGINQTDPPNYLFPPARLFARLAASLARREVPSGTVLLTMSTRTAEAGQHMIDIKRALHTGDICGLPTQILWMLCAFVLATQAVTGVLMWWNAKRRFL